MTNETNGSGKRGALDELLALIREAMRPQPTAEQRAEQDAQAAAVSERVNGHLDRLLDAFERKVDERVAAGRPAWKHPERRVADCAVAVDTLLGDNIHMIEALMAAAVMRLLDQRPAQRAEREDIAADPERAAYVAAVDALRAWGRHGAPIRTAVAEQAADYLRAQFLDGDQVPRPMINLEVDHASAQASAPDAHHKGHYGVPHDVIEHEARAGVIEFIEQYAGSMYHPASTSRAKLHDLVTTLRGHYGVPAEPVAAQPVAPRVRYGGPRRCRACGQPIVPGPYSMGIDPDRCGTCQPADASADGAR